MRRTIFSVSAFLIASMLVAVPAHAQKAADRGMKVFTESKCSMCHAIAGKGNAKGALDEVGSKLSADEIRQWIVDPQVMRDKAHAERKPSMKSYASLPKDDVDALVAYLQTLKTK